MFDLATPNFVEIHMSSVQTTIRRGLTISLFLASSLYGVAVSAQATVVNKPPPVVIPNPDIRKIPAQLQPDLAIVASGSISPVVYFAKIQNLGSIAAAATNVYCAANVQKTSGDVYSIERQPTFAALAAGASRSIRCVFSDGENRVKSGEKIFSVHFIVNNGHVIKESNYANNEAVVSP